MFFVYLRSTMNPEKGKILLSDPFLQDPNFNRTTILLCEYNKEGAIGFVVNKRLEFVLEDIVDAASGVKFAVYEGGPVAKTSLHFIHRKGALIKESAALSNGIYWGGDFEQVLDLIRNKQIDEKDIRFFVGYSGWSEGQLEDELKEKSWIVSDTDADLVFSTEVDLIWKESLKKLGGEYAYMGNYPSNPQLN